MSDEPMLHLYPQETWHANAAIVGTRKGLEALRAAIDGVLASGEEPNCYGMLTERVSATPADGEYHNLDVHLLPHGHANWRWLAEPYADNRDGRKDEESIMPPTWGWGLTRRLDVIELPADGAFPEDVEEMLSRYHDLSDAEKRDCKRRIEELESRGGAT